ncbi:MAG TPA: hypothetical protein VFE62_26660 [Gemmataceae bacterium]|nr:hypothetical protein [Gemmataceae bacterium]
MSKADRERARHTRMFEQWLAWSKSRSPEDKELQLLAYQFEDRHFADMTLTSPAVRRNLFHYEIEGDAGGSQAVEGDGPFLDLCSKRWILRVRTLPEGVSGQCHYRRHTISVRRGLDAVEHKATLLHEMIHAYESQLSEPVREWLLLDAHKRMAKRIKPAALRRYINASTHSLFHDHGHAILFMLKSLELDLRFGWDLGTVFGYGRKDLFA